MNIDTRIFGWFSSPDQIKPEHDPGIEGLCLICVKPLSRPVKTASLMRRGDHRSYFYLRLIKEIVRAENYDLRKELKALKKKLTASAPSPPRALVASTTD